ncbi:MAG: glycosyltransferase [Desulfovibrio sp.]|jgi:GT2 family glycosyltransferase/glycosyltransferase involved in cell wall biosynthesis|nr:glycosyltransferase [Desulfovibrio sp.]
MLLPANVAVILLNYNGGSDTVQCLEALCGLCASPGQIIVVDNDSSPEDRNFVQTSCERLRGDFRAKNTRMQLVFLPENNGYAAGNNAGTRLALQDSECSACWILNNDTEPASDALDRLCERLNQKPKAGVAGSTLVYAHDRETVQCAGGFKFSKYTGATPALHGNERLSAVAWLAPEPAESRLGFLCGASMLVRREVFEDIGLPAEEFFLYYEDAEFGLRARKAGYSLAWAPDSIVFHKEGGSTGAKSASTGRSAERPGLMDYLALRNRIYLIRTFFPVFIPLAVLSYTGVLLNRVRRGQARRVPMVFRAAADGLLGRMGKPRSTAEDEGARNILFLTARADFGGGPEHLWRLLQNMPNKMAAYVACPNESPYHERFREIVGESRMFELPHRLFSWRKLWRLRRFCRERGISVLHAHGKGAGLYARLLAFMTGLPCVHTFHGVHMDGCTPVKRAAYRLYERVMSLFTQMGIAVSEGELNQIVERGLMPRTKLRLIPNGVNVHVDLEAGERPLSSPYAVVSLSRFDYQKNSMFLLEIAKALNAQGRLEQFQFIVVGDGVDRQSVASSAQANGWGSHVLCPGASTHPHSFFRGALCYLSTSRWEGMPLAVLEAMAHGLSVVASDVVGNRDAVSHGLTGFLYPEGDAVAAADALCQLADDANLRCRMGHSAREYVQRNHSMDEMVAKTFDVLQEAARRNPNKSLYSR